MTSKYYDPSNMLSRGKFLNFILSHRGVGKTFCFKKWCLEDFIKRGKQFVWIRRYENETRKTRSSFYRDIRDKFKNNKLSVKGGNDSGEFIIDGKVAGYYLTLSKESSYKSNPFPNVDKIIFDEFIILKGSVHYLSNEVTHLFELIDTVFRDRDDVRGVYCLANNITFNNPYFLYFNIKPFDKEFYCTTKFGNQLLVQCYKNEAYIENKKKTKFGQLISGTDYGDYAIENKTLAQKAEFIQKKTPNAKFQYIIKYKGYYIGYWLDFGNGKMYASRKYNPDATPYALTREDMSLNTYLIHNMSNFYIKDLIWFFENALLFYEDQQVQDISNEIMSYFIR